MDNNKEVIELLELKKEFLKKLIDDDESDKKKKLVKELPLPSIKRR